MTHIDDDIPTNVWTATPRSNIVLSCAACDRFDLAPLIAELENKQFTVTLFDSAETNPRGLGPYIQKFSNTAMYVFCESSDLGQTQIEALSQTAKEHGLQETDYYVTPILPSQSSSTAAKIATVAMFCENSSSFSNAPPNISGDTNGEIKPSAPNISNYPPIADTGPSSKVNQLVDQLKTILGILMKLPTLTKILIVAVPSTIVMIVVILMLVLGSSESETPDLPPPADTVAATTLIKPRSTKPKQPIETPALITSTTAETKKTKPEAAVEPALPKETPLKIDKDPKLTKTTEDSDDSGKTAKEEIHTKVTVSTEPDKSPASPALDEPKEITIDPQSLNKAIRQKRIRALDNLLFVQPSKIPMNFQKAQRYCGDKTVVGIQGWRLPSIGELRSLTKAKMLPKKQFWSTTGADSFDDSKLTLDVKKNSIVVHSPSWRKGKVLCVINRVE